MIAVKLKPLPLVVGGLMILAAGALLIGTLFSSEIFPEYSPAHRGSTVARQAGCFSCHFSLPAGNQSNNPVRTSPGANQQVPGLFEERMSLEELRQWIENGISDTDRASSAHLAARESRLLQMPAYGERLEPDEIDDLVSYLALYQYRASASRGQSPEGEDVARRLACYTCHGELGQGGVQNPGSLKGYIPGFFGNDFRALTRNGNPQDLREWVLDGHSESFWNQGFAGFYPGRFFTSRQSIRMPAYREAVTDDELESLVGHLTELMEIGPLDGPELFRRRPFSTVAGPEPGGSIASDNSDPAGDGSFDPIQRIIETNCLRCHGPEKQRSGYRMDYRDAALKGGDIASFLGIQAIQPGQPEQSLAIRFVTALEEDPLEEIYPMPPGDNPRLTGAEIERLRAWIASGAGWPEGLVLKPSVQD